MAHPGGLNAAGCHNNRKTGDYHCHRSGASGAGARPSSKAKAAPAESSATTPYYANCAAARAAGVAPLRRGEPGYRAKLDRDQDGIACE